jgi:hypothetical protein
METRIRWRFRFNNGRPVRVLQYWDPALQWQDVLVTDYEDRERGEAYARSYVRTEPLPPGVIDFCEHLRRRQRVHRGSARAR